MKYATARKDISVTGIILAEIYKMKNPTIEKSKKTQYQFVLR
ncbi:Uncharacterised protein [Serratia quinivorans]|nr:Uncharacterised protein [Serratia quinivorans]CAI1124297.1 Uncharacterised protein [Serratia entomophila]CAI1974951.1 Uncharacterised protein [Serratia proteamaculans]CAI1033461.1 Uncharacterised protein [Serratia quinivorans]CAI1033966.1 Uncharacterised protein [Serratia quinivorans]